MPKRGVDQTLVPREDELSGTYEEIGEILLSNLIFSMKSNAILLGLYHVLYYGNVVQCMFKQIKSVFIAFLLYLNCGKDLCMEGFTLK